MPEPGQQISHYRILEKIGAGGMGIVYKALDLHLDRFVAIKTLPKDKVADPERRHRFIQEAKSASALNHPNIVTIYDIDEADGTYFIAMEYIQGKTIHEYIKAKELRLNQSLGYGIQIADALSKAHSAGIIHRDIKPSNIMITGDNHAKVLDFGLAKLSAWPEELPPPEENELTPSLEKLTGEGAVLGTLSYMSPEQARGRPVDHRTDIFSLGVMLYQMVAGELPFRGPHAAAVLDKLLYSPTPSIRSSDPSYPVALENTISRATAKDPLDRYQSMQELASDLRAVAGGEKVVRPLMNWRRRRSLLLGIAAIILLFLIVLPLRERLPRWLGGPIDRGEIVLAVLPFQLLGDDESDQILCDGLVERFVARFAQMENFGKPLRIISSGDVRAEGVTSTPKARQVFKATTVLTGNLQRFIDKISLTVNLVNTQNSQVTGAKIYDVAPDDLPRLEEYALVGIAEMLGLEFSPPEWQALNAGSTEDAEAYLAYIEGLSLFERFDIKENLDRAIKCFRQSVTKDPRHALAHAALGEACWRKWGLSEEQQWVDEALFHCEQAIEIDNRIADVYMTQGIIYRGTGQAEKAVGALRKAIELEPDNAKAYRELGSAYESVDEPEEAINAFSKAIELKYDDWYNHFSLGRFYANRSLYSEAATEFQIVIDLEPDHYYAYSALGGIYLYQGDFENAEQIFAQSLAIKETPEAYTNLSASYIFQNRAPEAVPLMEKAVKMEGASHEMWASLGDAYALTPDLAGQAPTAFKRALEMITKDLEVNPSNINHQVKFAYYLVRLGDKSQALEIVNGLKETASENSDILFWSALIYEWAGDRDRALETLAAAAEGGYSSAVIQAASDLDELRKDPRYRDQIESLWQQ